MSGANRLVIVAIGTFLMAFLWSFVRAKTPVPEDGAVVWRHQFHDVLTIRHVDEERVFYTHQSAGPNGLLCAITCLNRTSGALLWNHTSTNWEEGHSFSQKL